MTDKGRECSIANALEVIGEKWSLLIVRELSLGFHRFDEIAHNTGGSRDILATRLRTLTSAGVIEKSLYNERPQRFEYRLTPAGKELWPILTLLADWGDTYVTSGPPPTKWQHSCGGSLHPVVTCSSCGDLAQPDSVRVTRLGAVT